MDQELLQKKALLNAFKIVVTLTALYVASYAWFYNRPDFIVDQVTINTQSVNNVEISLDDGETWSNQGVFDIGDDFAFNNEITGDGIDLYRPISKLSDGTPTEFTEASSSTDYLEMEIMFRTNVDTAIFLNNDSAVEPSAGTNEIQLLGSEVARKSSFGDFTRDLIAASVRVSIIDSEYVNDEFIFNQTPSIVWAPNKNYRIYKNGGSYNVDLNSPLEQNYNYLNVINGFPSGEERVTNIKDNINVNYAENLANGDPLLTRINTVIDGYYMSKIRVKVWIEGNDRDTVTPLKGGLFKIKLGFAGLEKPDNESYPSVTANTLDNTIDGFDEGMEFSLNYGNNWIKHFDNPNPAFNNGDTVYVRFSESDDYLASNFLILQY